MLPKLQQLLHSIQWLPTRIGFSFSSCSVSTGAQHLAFAHCRASPTLSEEAQHAMRLPPVAVSRRRRTGVVLPEQLPADAGGGAGSSSVSEESDATPGAPPPKKRRSGACDLTCCRFGLTPHNLR